MKKGKFYGIGVGVGDPENITVKATKKLHEVDVIVLPEAKSGEGSTAFNIVKEYLKPGVEQMFLEFPMIKDVEARKVFRKNNADKISEELEKGKNVAFLTIGDPMTYSTYTYVLEHIADDVEVETIAGITSFNSIAARLNVPLMIGDEDLKVVSVNRKTDIYKEIENNDNFIVLDRIEYVFSLLKKNFVSSIEEQIQLALDGDRLEERIEEYLIDLPVELDTDYWYYDSCDVTEIYNIDIVGIELIDFDLDIWVGDVLDTKKLELQEGTGTVSASINVAFTMNVDYSVIDEDNSKYDRESHDYIIKNYINFTDEYKLERVIQINFEYYVEDENITFDDIYIDVNNETKLYLDQSEMTNQSFTTSFDERYLMPDEL